MTSTLTPTLAESAASTSKPRLGLVLAVVLIADIMDLLDSSLTNIAAPTIARELGGGKLLITWLGSSYALALGVLLVLGGRLGDKFGQRRIFLIGIAGFTLASLTCGLAVSPTMLILARLAQGGFGALLIPQGIAILTATFSRDQFGKVFSIFGPVLGVSMVLGPILGAFLIDANIAGLSWRSMFLINILLGVVGFFAALKVLPVVPGNTSVILDGVGSGLLAATMFSLIYGLITGSNDGWGTRPYAFLIAGAVFFALFCWRQAVAKNPLIKPSLLAHRGFTSGLLLGLVFFAAVSGFAYVISLYFQVGLGRTPTGAALGLIPMAAGIVVASVANAGLIARLGRVLIFIGLVIVLVAVGGLAAIVGAAIVGIVGISASAWALVPPIFVLGLGMGTCFGTVYDVALGEITQDEAGSASGSLSAVQQLASSIGAAVMVTVYFNVVRDGGQQGAMLTSLAVVAGVTALCLGLVWLMPRKAPAQEH